MECNLFGVGTVTCFMDSQMFQVVATYYSGLKPGRCYDQANLSPVSEEELPTLREGRIFPSMRPVFLLFVGELRQLLLWVVCSLLVGSSSLTASFKIISCVIAEG